MSVGAISGAMPDLSALRSQMQQLAADKFSASDADGSGGLSLAEFKEAQSSAPFGAAKTAGAPPAEEIFATLDADGDGEVTSSEFTNAKPSFVGNFSSGSLSAMLAAQEDAGGSPFLQQAPGSDTDLISQLFDVLDADSDDDA